MDAGQSYSLSGTVSGSGSLTKEGSGTFTLTGANTFNDATIVNAGTLNLSAASGNALANTSAITVNAGGAIATGGYSEGSASAVGLGALTLTGAGSQIDFGTGAVGMLNIASFDPGVDTLQIDNWTGTANTSGNGSTDRLIFNSDQTANLGSFSFTGYTGATEFVYEITPFDVSAAPESSTWFAAGLALLAAGYHQRRRLRSVLRAR